MAHHFRPTDDAHVCEAVAWAVSEDTPLEVLGHGSKKGLGRSGNYSATIDLSDLAGITYYEDSELALSAGAGTALADVVAALAENNQQLAFEPPDLGPLLGAPAGQATLGGIVACNLSGPRRIAAGAARDHFLGVQAVNGRGELFKSGGRVVKNVTGYDLCKALAGSYGTLAILTDITMKVLPAAEKTRTVLVGGLDDTAAVAVLGKVAGAAFEATALAHLPASIAARSQVGYVKDSGSSVTAVRLEGTETSVLYRCDRLREHLASHGAVEELHGRNSAVMWREIGNASPFVAPSDHRVWRLSVPPAAAAAVVAQIATSADCEWYFDWAGGLIWLAVAPSLEDGGADPIRGAIARAGQGGHATLVRADADLRARVPVFEPQPAPLAALSARLKEQFDPRGVLNPGRMVAEG
jgi:glycolate oxidase FAD binding subunit